MTNELSLKKLLNEMKALNMKMDQMRDELDEIKETRRELQQAFNKGRSLQTFSYFTQSVPGSDSISRSKPVDFNEADYYQPW